MTPKLAAIAVVVDQGRTLVVQRKNEPDAGLWGFPGGHVEWGETAMDAAARELHEETGVIATPRRYLTNIDVITRDANGGVAFHFLLAAVLCEYQSGTPQAADDVADARWVSMQMLHTLPCSARVQEIIALATREH